MRNLVFIRRVSVCLLTLVLCPAHAFNWHDWFATHDQQAMQMMDKGQYEQAEQTFQRDDWRATAAYRAGDYSVAAKRYPSMKQGSASYNEGNALAHMGQYENAIKAYDKALAVNPHDEDAIHNRKLIEELLKQQKEKQQDQNQKDQDQQQNQQQQDQNQQNNQQNQPDQTQQNQNQSDQNQQNKEQQNKQNQNQSQSSSQNQNQNQSQDQQKQNEPSQQESSNTNQASANSAKESQQEKEQLMKIIPDDPGGLLKEKFHRDYLRRQQGYEP